MDTHATAPADTKDSSAPRDNVAGTENDIQADVRSIGNTAVGAIALGIFTGSALVGIGMFGHKIGLNPNNRRALTDIRAHSNAFMIGSIGGTFAGLLHPKIERAGEGVVGFFQHTFGGGAQRNIGEPPKKRKPTPKEPALGYAHHIEAERQREQDTSCQR